MGVCDAVGDGEMVLVGTVGVGVRVGKGVKVGNTVGEGKGVKDGKGVTVGVGFSPRLFAKPTRIKPRQ